MLRAARKGIQNVPTIFYVPWTCFSVVSDIEDSKRRRHVIRPNITQEEAEKQFLKFHRQGLLSPGSAVLRAGYAWKTVMVPCWLFSGKFTTRYSADIFKKNEKGEYGIWKSIEWEEKPPFSLPQSNGYMQVFGTYDYRPDFLEKMKPLGSIYTVERVKTDFDDTLEKEFKNHSLLEPTIPRYLAWNFALRNVQMKEVKRFRESLQKRFEGCRIRNLKVMVSGHPKHSGLAYVPVHVIDYIYGKKINIHGERYNNAFYSLVSGIDGRVAGDAHVSVPKAAVVGGISMLGSMMTYGLVDMSIGNGPSLWAWSLYDVLFPSASVAACTGLLAQVLPEMRRQNDENIFLARAETEAFLNWEKDNIKNLEYKEVDRLSREWLRWEQGDKYSWNPEKRKKWAETIWRNHKDRLKAMKKEIEARELDMKRRKADYEREQRRTARWGPGSRKFTGENQRVSTPRDVDYLGYYAALGLDPSSFITQHDIKKHFHKAVMTWHPDKHKNVKDKDQAKKNFQQIVRAYEVLKHPSSRKKYDIGEYSASKEPQ